MQTALTDIRDWVMTNGDKENLCHAAVRVMISVNSLLRQKRSQPAFLASSSLTPGDIQ
jgi:hypothetical protein